VSWRAGFKVHTVHTGHDVQNDVVKVTIQLMKINHNVTSSSWNTNEHIDEKLAMFNVINPE